MRSMKTALAIIAVAGLSACASTSTSNSSVDGYVKSPDGKVLKDPFDLCWRTGFWSPANANQECDKDLAPKAAAPAPAPAVAAPARPAAPPAAVAPVVPAPVAPRAVTPPAPPPAPVAAAAPKMCSFAASFENDELFAFNKSVLTPSAKSRLDGDVMTKIANCKELKLVLVNGHTDRLGTAGYNQKLSEKRASVVQAYLTSKGVKDVETLGNGKTLPIKSCDDKAPRKAQIECLAPNRRVVIEVTGTAK
jgi:OmpA-OmpF porin, OOP family